MLELVVRLLGDKAEFVLDGRKKEPLEGRPRVLIYGGAIHNNLYFDPVWKSATFGPRIQRRVGGRYVAVDVYVPEFVEGNDILKEEPWYPLLLDSASAQQVALLELASDSYVILFRRVVENAPAAAVGAPKD